MPPFHELHVFSVKETVAAEFKLTWELSEHFFFLYNFLRYQTVSVVLSELTAMGSFWAISISKEYMIHSMSFLITPVKTEGVF